MINYQTALILACLANEEAFYNAKGLRLEKEAFDLPECAALWDAMSKNADDGSPHSKVEIWMRVQQDYPDKCRDYENILSLAAREVDDLGRHEKWAEHVAKEWIERIKREAFAEAIERVHQGESIIDVSHEMLERVARAEDNVTLEEQRLERSRAHTLERIRNRIRGTGGTVSTGIKMLDDNFGQLLDHEFIVMAARPGCGKSSLARQICVEHVRMCQQPVMIFSLEMSVDQVVQYMAGAECGVSSFRISDGFKNDQDILDRASARFAAALGTYFHIRDNVLSLNEIEHEIQMAVRRHKPALIVIDYIQQVTVKNAGRMPREQQIATISRRFKQLAQMHRVPIIGISQMNREYEKEDRRPRLSDLRESGSLEQDADRVWFIHGKSEKCSESQATIIQEKCRGGACAEVECKFLRYITKFQFGPKILAKEDLGY